MCIFTQMKSILFKTAIPSAIILLPWFLFVFGLPLWVTLSATPVSVWGLYKYNPQIAKESLPFLTILFLGLCWQAVYFSIKADTSTDIFRGVYENPVAPLYGKIQILRPWMLLLILVVLPLFLSEKIKNNWVFFSVGTLLLLAINYSDGPRRIEKFKSHIETFTEGRSIYPETVDWSTYQEKMGQLGVHNDHYPPLPLTLLNLFGTKATLFSIFMIACSLLCMKLLKTWLGPEIALTLPPLLFFTTYTWVPIHLLVILSIILASKSKNQWIQTLIPGILLGGYAFFSFGVFVVSALFFVFQWGNKPDAKTLKTLALQGSIATILVLVISFFTQYNYLEAFDKARHLNDQLLNQPTYYFPVIQGIYRSFGNLLSFFFVLGPLVVYSFFRFRGKVLWMPLLALVAMAFSGLFYMETERVWVFFIPFLFFSGALKKPIPLYLYTSQIIFIILIETKIDLSFGAFY